MLRKLERLIALHGLFGGLKVCAAKALAWVLLLSPAHRRARARQQDRDSEFDRKWGVDTKGTYVPKENEVVGSNWVNGCRYQGCDVSELEQMMKDLAIEHPLFTFIDFGSGKGRAILIASQFPFKKVIGVEYSKQLSEIAKQNVARFPKKQRRAEIEAVCADAGKFPIPEGPLVIFLYNPFGKAVMTEVARNVQASFQQNPRRIIVLYLSAEPVDVWEEMGFLQGVSQANWLRIYDTQAARPLESV